MLRDEIVNVLVDNRSRFGALVELRCIDACFEAPLGHFSVTVAAAAVYSSANFGPAISKPS